MMARRIIPMLLAAALAAPAALTAQEPDREKIEEAQRRAQEAQVRLRAAIEQLQRSQSEEAQREMERAIDELRRAQRELRGDVYADLVRELVTARGDLGNAIMLADAGRPKMGVILGSSDWRSATDSVGVVIQGITPGGPAEEAGLRTGDVIVTANGQSLGRQARREQAPNDRLVGIIRELDEGETLHVVYRRGDSRGEADVIVRPVEPAGYSFAWSGDSAVAVRLRAMQDVDLLRVPDVAVEVEPLVEGAIAASLFLPYRWLSMELAELDDEAGQAQFGTSEGLLVVKAPRDSTLDLRAYDVILNIDGRVPTSPSQAIRIMRSYEPGETMNIEIMRNRQRRTVSATVPDPGEALRMRLDRRPQ